MMGDQKSILKRYVLIIMIVIFSMMVVLFWLPSLLLTDRFLTDELQSVLQKGLKDSGLVVQIGNIHWEAWNGLVGTQVAFKERQSGRMMIRAKGIQIRLNPFVLIMKFRNPEACLQKIILEQPQLWIERYADNTWNLQCFFKSKEHRLLLAGLVQLKDGQVTIQDYEYGNYVLKKVTGTINLERYPALSWRLRGKSYLGSNVSWTSQGKLRSDQQAGHGSIAIKNGSLTKISRLIPHIFSYQVGSGFVDLQLNFALTKEGFGIEKVKATIHDASISLPQLPHTLKIKYLNGEISPNLVQIKKADLCCAQTPVSISGMINLRNHKLKAEIAAAQINLAEWRPLLGKLNDFQITGRAGLKLKINGTIRSPEISGEINLNKMKVAIQNAERFEQISGRIIIVHNEVTIDSFKGVWNEAPFEISGRIIDILKPSFDLKLWCNGFNLQSISWLQTANLSIKNDKESSFQAKITGSIQNPNLICTMTFNRLTYQEVPVQDLKIQLNWSFKDRSIQILKVSGNIWEGELAAKGLIVFESSGIKWMVSGKVSSLDLGKISLANTLPIQGKVSTDAVLRGNWNSSEPFQIGSILGTFTGTSLRFSDAMVDEAEGVYSWNNGNLIIDSIQAKINQGRIFGYLSLNNQAELSINVNAENIRLRHLLPDAKKFPGDGIFKGSFAFEGPMAQFSGQISGAFTGMTWNSKPIGDISGSLIYRNNQFSITNLLISTDSGNFTVKGNMNIADEPFININITGSNTNLNGLAKWLPIDPSIRIDGLGQIDLNITGSAVNPSFHGQIQLTDPAFGIIKMKEGLIELSGNLTEMSLVKCQLRNDNSFLELSGKVDRNRIDLNIASKSFDLSSLHLTAGDNTLQGLVDFNGQLSGATGDPVLNADISGGQLSFGALSYQSLKAKLTWNSHGLVISKAELKQENSSLSLNGQMLFLKPIECELEIQVVSCEISKLRQLVKIPAQLQIDGSLSGTIKINGPIDNPVIKINGSISQGTFNNLPMLGDFDIEYSNNKININGVELYQGNGAIMAHGVWESQRSLSVQIRLINYPLQIVNQFIGPSVKLAGVVNSNIQLEWSAAKISGEYDMEISNLDINGNIFGNLRSNGSLTKGGLMIKNNTINGKNGIINGTGFIPWPNSLAAQYKLPVVADLVSRQLGFNLTIKSLPVSLVNNFISGLTVSSGLIEGNLQIHGAITRPLISGKLDCNNLKVDIDGLPLPIDGFQAAVSINDNQIQIKKALGSYGTGKFNVTGAIGFEEFKQLRFNLGLTGSRIYYSNSFFDGYGDVNLKLTGTFNDSLISGDILVSNSKVGIVGVSPAGKNSKIAWLPKLNLVIKVENNTRCRVIGFADLAIKGAVQVKGTPAEPVLNGEIDSNNGVLTFYNNAFRIKKAKAVFKFSQGYNPYLDLESSLKRAQEEIYLNIKGLAPDGINISLTSQPFMPQANIFGLLNWTELEAGESLNPQDVISGNISVVTDTIFGDFLYQLRQTLNVNYLYLEPDRENNDFRINMGSFLTQQLSYSYSRSIFPENKKSWTISFNYYFDPTFSLEYNYSDIDGAIWRLIYQIQL
jgi:autotransporter translocation and assembly factor TamB